MYTYKTVDREKEVVENDCVGGMCNKDGERL